MIRKTTNHELKTHPEYFQEVWDKKEPFEIRKDDRGFDLGDQLTLREWDPDKQEYTGRQIYIDEITYIFSGGLFGVEEETVVLGFAPGCILKANSNITHLNPIKIFQDGDVWCALLGENMQTGEAGFGYTPTEALNNLIKNVRL